MAKSVGKYKMTDDNQKDDKQPAKVIAKAPKDKEFPKLKTLTYKEMYNIVGKFLQKAIPMKREKIKIVKGLTNRVSSPKPPYVVLQVMDEKTLSSSETRYTDQYKITWSRSQVTIELSFIGSENAPALQIAKAFTVRFNDSWATEQFEQYNNDVVFPLYSDEVRVEPMFLNEEGQFEDTCIVHAHFEYHPELGICANSAKTIVMDVNISK